MKVQIEGDLFIESDPYNFILKEQKARQDGSGDGKIVIHGYFSTLESAANHVVKMKIKQSTAKTLQELVSDVRSIKEYIHSQLGI
ncbi:hypothetical protein [Paenibacillus woosongensis]|uniref:Uncharacterized protein n=1 Tax=Paenibacillus woosongensis TaxID=307580 RepID=A0A7X2YXA5_9BACL|nr:hypothetical protein [Paenibacillus woosongensis]MUG43447.1 hypothetical protein [Paenibacillus woosongensis]